MSGPIFSVVIPTYCRPEVLARTLSCLDRQECNFPFEVILVNDGPPDELPELGLGVGKRTNWRLLQNESNLKRAATRNRGIKAAQGEYVLMIDDDIWAVPGLLQAHYDKQIEIGGGVVIGSVPIAVEVKNTVWNEYVRDRYKAINYVLENKTGKLLYYYFLTGNVSIVRTVLDDVGGFDERFKCYSLEDSELGLRLQKKGLLFYHAPNAIGYHYSSEDLNSLLIKAFEWGRSSYVFGLLHPAEVELQGIVSYTLQVWHGFDILKNILKILLFNKTMVLILKMIMKILSFFKAVFLVKILFPWLEFFCRAQGYKYETKYQSSIQKVAGKRQ